MPASGREPPVETLIVDDVERLREVVASAMEDATGFRVAGHAADGREAIEQARDLQPDLVLLNLSMPRMIPSEPSSTRSRISRNGSSDPGPASTPASSRPSSLLPSS